MQAISFKNFTDNVFTWNWDGVPYTFQPGQEMYLEDYKAIHFAKHLADIECNRMNIPTNDPRRTAIEAQALPVSEVVTPVEAIDIEEKKKVGKKSKKVEAPEFEDLDPE